MARARRHLGLRLVFITAVAFTLAGLILVIVISFQPGTATLTYAPLGSNRWKSAAAFGALVGVPGAVTAVITGAVRRRLDDQSGRDAAWAGQLACVVAVVYCGIVASLVSSHVKDKAATMPVPATITACSQPDPDNSVLRCSYRWEVAGHVYSDTADSFGSAGQHVVIDVVPADPGVFNSTPGQDASLLGTDLALGLLGGPVLVVSAGGWFLLETGAFRNTRRTR
jgi:hypothetical protein